MNDFGFFMTTSPTFKMNVSWTCRFFFFIWCIRLIGLMFATYFRCYMERLLVKEIRVAKCRNGTIKGLQREYQRLRELHGNQWILPPYREGWLYKCFPRCANKLEMALVEAHRTSRGSSRKCVHQLQWQRTIDIGAQGCRRTITIICGIGSWIVSGWWSPYKWFARGKSSQGEGSNAGCNVKEDWASHWRATIHFLLWFLHVLETWFALSARCGYMLFEYHPNKRSHPLWAAADRDAFWRPTPCNLEPLFIATLQHERPKAAVFCGGGPVANGCCVLQPVAAAGVHRRFAGGVRAFMAPHIDRSCSVAPGRSMNQYFPTVFWYQVQMSVNTSFSFVFTRAPSWSSASPGRSLQHLHRPIMSICVIPVQASDRSRSPSSFQ